MESKSHVKLRGHRIGDMGWIVQRESIGYAEQYGWDETFEPFLLKLATEFLEHYDPACERCWIAEIEGRAAGHLFLMKDRADASVARLRLLYVEPEARGKGVADALVNECIRFASAAGYRKVALWTQSFLTIAVRMYERAGFRLISEAIHCSFGKEMLGQNWELDL